MRDGWIGVDLDGTLAAYGKWNDQRHKIGEPVKAMMDRVVAWRESGKTVKIFTARASDPEQMERVRTWLTKHGLGDIEVTNAKDFDMIELWDDRAIRVERNTGRILQGRPVKMRRPASRFGR